MMTRKNPTTPRDLEGGGQLIAKSDERRQSRDPSNIFGERHLVTKAQLITQAIRAITLGLDSWPSIKRLVISTSLAIHTCRRRRRLCCRLVYANLGFLAAAPSSFTNINESTGSHE